MKVFHLPADTAQPFLLLENNNFIHFCFLRPVQYLYKYKKPQQVEERAQCQLGLPQLREWTPSSLVEEHKPGKEIENS